ncbi:MAG: 23S rRNA (adenine(2030)-N(6))-methyltransferase RlmJ [Rhizobiaceae bacterium]|nr:23S rRNA (adenine(2030)-N(6))-methyltransferase RlmJ [Rhizobiaceae bacterium]
MNYRHAFHAGNFADVMKHALLARIILYLQRKEAAFRVIDTHAGTGRYSLASEAAAKTGEWLDGIGRLREAKLPDPAAALLEPYLDIALPMVTGAPAAYPGSPLVTRRLLRKQDRLTALELHPEDGRRLAKQFEGDFQVRVIALDGWLALGAHLPPKEKRGVVLIDPPFEEPGEFDRMIDGVTKAHKRWPGGTYALWYPVKDRNAVSNFRFALVQSGIPDIIDAEIIVRDTGGERLDGCGMAVINPPYTLEAECKAMLAALAPLLAMEPRAARWSVKRLAK